MRFLSLLLSGCALVDAAGESNGSSGGLAFDSLNIGGGGPSPRQALAAALDTVNGTDVVVIDSNGNTITRCLNDGTGRNFSCQSTPFTGYELIAVGEADDVPGPDVVAVGINKLHVLRPNVSVEGFVITDLSGGLDPADASDLPVALTVGNFAAGRGIVVGYQQSTKLRFVPAPPVPATGTSIEFATQPAPLAIRLAAADVKIGDLSDELLAAEGSGTFAVFTDAGFNLGRLSGDPGDPTSVVKLLAVGDFISGTSLEVVLSVDRVAAASDLVTFFASPSGLMVDTGAAPPFGEGTVAIDLGAADVDGDGKSDVAVLTQEDTRRIKVFPGVDNGQQVGPQRIVEIENAANRITFGDFNNDGKADVLLLPPQGGGVDYLLSR